MKFKDIYNKAVKRGLELDPRGVKEVKAELAQIKKGYDKLGKEEKKYFDKEKLTNPYSDTRMLNGSPGVEVKRVMMGIDIDVSEVLLADRLNQKKGKKIDLIIAHHPQGTGTIGLGEVMAMQAGVLAKFGVPIHVGESLLAERSGEVGRRLMPANHTKTVDAAKLLGIPLMCMHTPTDNAVTTFLQDIFDKAKPVYISDIFDILHKIPEYEYARANTIGPKLVVGSKERKAGKIFVDMTGGTGGSKLAFEKLSAAGVGTIVGMHIGDDHRKEAEKHHMNVLLAGHISSDNLGINLLMDDIFTGVDVVECSGFRRFTRKRKKKS
jgi:putative NIF3 family GTP cyclohydrolase 1 type 2